MSKEVKDGGRVIRRQTGFLPKKTFDMHEISDLLLEHAVQCGTITGFPAWLIHVKKWHPKSVPHVNTIKYWMKHHPEFKEVVDLMRDIALGSEIYILDGAKMGQVPNYDYRAHKMKMMNMFGWKDKVEHSGDIVSGSDRREEMQRIMSDPETSTLIRALAKRMAAQSVDKDVDGKEEEET